MLYLCHRKISKASNLCQQHGPAERGHHQLPGCFASLKARWQDGRHNLRVLAFFVLSLAVSNLIKQMCIDVYLTLQHYSYRFKHSWLSAHLAYPQLPTLWGPMAVAYVLPTLKMEEEDPNRDPTRAHFQRLPPMAVAYVLPILKMEEEDPNRDPTRAHFWKKRTRSPFVKSPINHHLCWEKIPYSSIKIRFLGGEILWNHDFCW